MITRDVRVAANRIQAYRNAENKTIVGSERDLSFRLDGEKNFGTTRDDSRALTRTAQYRRLFEEEAWHVEKRTFENTRVRSRACRLFFVLFSLKPDRYLYVFASKNRIIITFAYRRRHCRH